MASTLDTPVPFVEIVRPDLDAAASASPPFNRLIHTSDNRHTLAALLSGDDQHPALAGQVDLIYLDPPFAVQTTFASTIEIPLAGTARPLRLKQPAYDDTWPGGLDGYLAMMRQRLTLLHALLKPTGALYLHCDWHASHHLKLLLDDLFGVENFRNEIVWAYRSGGASRTASLSRKHDVIFLYARTPAFSVRSQVERQYLAKPFIGSRRDAQGRHYVDTLLRDVIEGEILLVEGDRLVPYNTRPVLNLSAERTGFATQKPLGLLRLLLRLASDPGDLVLDPFCGSGTTALAAESLTDDSGSPAPRQWIALDRGAHAVATARKRLIIAHARPFTIEHAGGLASVSSPSAPSTPVSSPSVPTSPTIPFTVTRDATTITVTLQRPPLDPASRLHALDGDQRAQLEAALTADWSILIDTWSVDWAYRDGAPFDPDWRALRTRKNRLLPLIATHTYATPGEKCIAVHLTDIFGNVSLTTLRLTL